MENMKNFLTQTRLEHKIFDPKKFVDYGKSEFTSKQRKMYLKTSMSKIRLPHIYRDSIFFGTHKTNNTFFSSIYRYIYL